MHVQLGAPAVRNGAAERRQGVFRDKRLVVIAAMGKAVLPQEFEVRMARSSVKSERVGSGGQRRRLQKGMLFHKDQSSISSNASRPFFAAAFTSPCRTNSIVTNDSATNVAAYGNRTW